MFSFRNSFPKTPPSTFVAFRFDDELEEKAQSLSTTSEMFRSAEFQDKKIVHLKIYDSWQGLKLTRIRYCYSRKPQDTLPPLRPDFAIHLIEEAIKDPIETSPYAKINERAFRVFSEILTKPQEQPPSPPPQMPKVDSLEGWDLIESKES